MNFLKNSLSKKISLLTRIFFPKTHYNELQRLENYPSRHLKRPVKIDIYLPVDFFRHPEKSWPVLFFNDGQDMEAVALAQTLAKRSRKPDSKQWIIAAIYAANRMQEYGTAHQADYKNRGSKAGAYSQFITKELLPFLQRRYRASTAKSAHAIAGFSLGGLSAFDIAWNHPDIFFRVGVFSGSLWWRSKAFKPADPDADRIVHQMVQQGKIRPGLRFWFQAGTKDETSDRNNNGIIDAIDDTLDLMKSLKNLGYSEADMQYVEVKNGEHNPATWAKVLPKFLTWLEK